jgi:hypothetical protein
VALRRRRELPLCWHFAITVIITGAWALIGSWGVLTAGWDYAF